MGLGGISPGSLLLIFFIVLILFGTKKLRTIGEDLGQAVRGFRRAMNQEESWYRAPQTEQADRHEENQAAHSAASSQTAALASEKVILDRDKQAG